MDHSSIYLNDTGHNQHNLISNAVYEEEMMQQPEKKHTVVVLVDDPEQQRQMMLEQEMEDNQKLELLRQQTIVSNTYQNLTTVTVLNLEQCY